MQRGLESIMDSVAFGSPFAHDMRGLERAVRDLNSRVSIGSSISCLLISKLTDFKVKASDMSNKDILASSLDNFVSLAKKGSRLLSQLDAGAEWAVNAYVFLLAAWRSPYTFLL